MYESQPGEECDMSNDTEFQVQPINNESTIKSYKELISKWSNALPYPPIENLGEHIASCSATQYYLYQLRMTTHIATRYFEERETGKHGQASSNPRSIDRIDIMGVCSDDFTSDMEVPLNDTCFERTCGTCQGDGKVSCSKCSGSGQLNCSKCGGSGQIKYTEKIPCQSCGGKGRIKQQEPVERACPVCSDMGFDRKKRCIKCGDSRRIIEQKMVDRSCQSCDGKGYHAEPRQKNCSECGATGKIACPTCNSTGQVKCSKCDGYGTFEYIYFMVQKQSTRKIIETWGNENAPVFEEKFIALDRLEAIELFSKAYPSMPLFKVLPELANCHFARELENLWVNTQNEIQHLDNTHVNEQKIEFIKYTCAVKLDYTFKGKQYTEWINPTTERIEEYGNGVLADFSTLTAAEAQKYEEEKDLHHAAQSYLKASIIDHKNTEYVNNAKRMGQKIYQAVAIPMFLGYFSTLVLYFARGYPTKTADIIYGAAGFFILLLMQYIFKFDLMYKFVEGRQLLVVAGLIIGYTIGPKNVTNFAVSNNDFNWIIYSVVGVIAWLIIRLYYSLRIMKWNEFIKAEKTAKTYQNTIDSLSPSLGWTVCIMMCIVGTAWLSYKNSSDGVSKEAIYNRGLYLVKTKSNEPRGYYFMKTSAERGYVPAKYMQGSMLLKGQGVTKNEQDAIKIIKEVAELGNQDARILLGECFEKAIGVDQDMAAAYQWYVKATEDNNKGSSFVQSVKTGWTSCLSVLHLSSRKDGDLKNETYTIAKQNAQRIAEVSSCWSGAHSGNSDDQLRLAKCYVSGNGITQDDKMALGWLKKAADQGIIEAQLIAGEWTINGKGTEKDIARGLKYYELAADQNSEMAYSMLGDCYFDGIIIEADYLKAVKYLTKAVTKEIPSALFKLGVCYRNGLGVKQDFAVAFPNIRKAAEKGYCPALYCMGESYEYGNGISIDYTKALACYKASLEKTWECTIIKKTIEDGKAGSKRLENIGKYWALANEKKDAQAQHDVGLCFMSGDGVPVSSEEALKWFKLSEEQGNYSGAARVADFKYYGIIIPQDIPAAVRKYQEMSEKGLAYAQFRLGQCYESGIGTNQNLTTALSYFKQSQEHGIVEAADSIKKISRIAAVWNLAIEENNAKAQLELGKCYWEGDGIKTNLVSAFSWFEKSSKQGNGEALYRVALCYEKGDGVNKDSKLAVNSYILSAEAKYVPSAYALGVRFEKGNNGVDKNLTDAYKYYEIASQSEYEDSKKKIVFLKEIALCWTPAFSGDPKAQYMLGECIRKGSGIDKDEIKANEWLTKSAESGYPNAQYDLAVQLLLMPEKERDIKSVVEWLNKSVQSGYANAQAKLGELYFEGIGVKENTEKALELWEKAIEQKNADAMFLLGKYRFSGQGLFNSGKDVNKAIALWTEASDLNHHDASFMLGKYYCDEGIFSSAKDKGKGFSFYTKAADAGHMEAMYTLGKMLLEQNETQQQGLSYLKKAGERGHKESIKLLQKNGVTISGLNE